MKLPQVHIAVNVAGLTAAIGSAATWALGAGAGCVQTLPAHDALAATAIAGAIAAFLPTKRSTQP